MIEKCSKEYDCLTCIIILVRTFNIVENKRFLCLGQGKNSGWCNFETTCAAQKTDHYEISAVGHWFKGFSVSRAFGFDSVRD